MSEASTQPSAPEDCGPVPRVLQVLPTLKTGGAEKTTVDIAAALADRGWGAFVGSAGGRMAADVEARGGRHIELPLDTKNPIRILRNAARLVRVIEENRINIIHARSRGPAWSALLAARRTGIRFVTTYHGAYTQPNFFKVWYNSVMGRADRIIANSEWTADLVRERHPDAGDRIIAIARGTDFSLFSSASVSDDRKTRMLGQWGLTPDDNRFLVLLLGRITSLKGHRYLIEAADRTRSDLPNGLFVFAGDAHGREGHGQSLRDQIKQLGLEKRVIMPGHCDDPAAAMALADVVVSASTQAETFGRTVVEAAALEKPVIVTRIGAVVETVLVPPEVPETQRTGWKVEPADGAGLAAALRTVAGLPEGERRAIGQRGRAHVLERFSLQQMCEKTLAVYVSLLAP